MSHLVGKLVNTSDVLTLRRVTNIEYREEGSFYMLVIYGMLKHECVSD